ncbi:cyclin-dependent kinase inhibitor 1Ba isoform X2 [Brachionichthys hirsutus]|uniref:cyclin-dependent kinase inhibitor 1Ba isoform X2 n=1 Tax=Brachionichthys hirsutus TaxID=412623 RepID=UPI003604D9B3
MCNKMSDVRLSNASPTLERVDARQQDAARTSVRKNLFGSPDPQDVRRCLEGVIREGVRTFREEYNYDPVGEAPLPPGNYEWEAVSDAPEFFSRAPHGGGQRPRRGAEGPGREGSRKRGSEAPGPSSTETRSKRSHTDEDDDEEESDVASQAGNVAEDAPSRPETGAEVP